MANPNSDIIQNAGVLTAINPYAKNYTNGLTATLTDNVVEVGLDLTGLSITNTTTANTISVDQNGNVGTDVATDGAVHIENTGNTGIGLGIYTNIGATADAPLVSIHADNTAFDQNVVLIKNDGSAYGLKIESYGATGDALGILANGAACTAINAQSGGNAVTVALVSLSLKNTTDSGDVLVLDHKGTGNGSHIKFTGDCPNTVSEDGDFWFDGTNLKINVAGTVYNIDKTAV